MNASDPFARRSVTVARDASAYFAVFCRASSAEK